MAYRNYSTAVSHIVNATGQGDFTTIGAAITAASSGDTIFIHTGTYTENLTLKAGVNLAAFSGDESTPNVTIIGKATFTTAGTVSISSIRLQTNSDFFLSVTGSSVSVVNLKNCYLNCSNNTGIQFTSSSSSINILSCNGEITTTGISLFSQSSNGGINFQYTTINNSGSSTTASTVSAGSVDIKFCDLAFPITTSSTASLQAQFSIFATISINTTALTLNGTGLSNVDNCIIEAGTASAISIGTGATLALLLCSVQSSNTNAITGTGTLNAGIITFTGSSSTINTSTVNKLTTYGGTIV